MNLFPAALLIRARGDDFLLFLFASFLFLERILRVRGVF